MRVTGGAGEADGRYDGRRHAILALDTATTRIVVALGLPDGTPIGLTHWRAGYRHGEQLLPGIQRALGEANVRRSRLDAIVIGTGPGAFTGLRVGLATAKALAHALGRPIVGVPTGGALLAAAARADDVPLERLALLLPAGPADRVLVRGGEPARLIPGGEEPEFPTGTVLVALDLDGRAPAEALARGERAFAGLGEELLREGALRLAAGRADDLARLVPEYVTLPRGVAAVTGVVRWSRDHR